MPERPPDDRAEPVRDIRDRHAEPAENERQDEPRIAHGNERQVIEKLFRIFRPERLICTGELAEERKRDDSISSPERAAKLVEAIHFRRRYKADEVEEGEQDCPAD